MWQVSGVIFMQFSVWMHVLNMSVNILNQPFLTFFCCCYFVSFICIILFFCIILLVLVPQYYIRVQKLNDYYSEVEKRRKRKIYLFFFSLVKCIISLATHCDLSTNPQKWISPHPTISTKIVTKHISNERHRKETRMPNFSKNSFIYK